MKKLLLIAATIAYVTGGHSLMAQNLITNPSFTGTSTATVAGWTFTPDAALTTSTGVISGSASALLSASNDTTFGDVTSSTTFATTPGATYFVQFAYESVNAQSATNNNISEIDVEVDGTNGAEFGSVTLTPKTTGSTSYISFFTANSATSTIDFFGRQASVDDVSVKAGTYTASKVGRFSGTVKVTGTFPGQNFGAINTQSVVGNVNSNGGLTFIEEPSGNVDTAAIDTTGTDARPKTTLTGTIFIDGTTTPITEAALGGTVTFTATENNINGGGPGPGQENQIEKFSLHKVGPAGN